MNFEGLFKFVWKSICLSGSYVQRSVYLNMFELWRFVWDLSLFESISIHVSLMFEGPLLWICLIFKICLLESYVCSLCVYIVFGSLCVWIMCPNSGVLNIKLELLLWNNFPMMSKAFSSCIVEKSYHIPYR